MNDFTPMPRVTIEQIVGNYDLAMSLYEKAHHALEAAQQAVTEANRAARACCPDGTSGMNYRKVDEIDRFYNAVQTPGKDEYLRVARRLLAINTWSHIVDSTKLYSLMDGEAKEQFRQQMEYWPPNTGSREVAKESDIQAGLPPITVENITATIEQFAEQAPDIMMRGMANVFSKLDRRFRSHDGFKVGDRVILTHVFSAMGWMNYGSTRDSLIDIERVFTVLDGRVDGTFDQALNALRSSREGETGARQSYVETEYFRIRGFKNGNAHLWFKRDDLVQKVNVTLGKFYGEDKLGYDIENPGADPFADPKRELAKDFAFFPTPEAVADVVIDKAMLYQREGDKPLEILEPSAGTGNLARRCAEQTWPDGWDQVSQKNRVRVMRQFVDCYEVQSVLAGALRRSGHYRSVVEGDFLDAQPTPRYDRVVMNPPFDRERDIDHVVHALGFLKPGGRLVAVMSAGTEFRQTKKATAFRKRMEEMGAEWRDLPAGSFSSVGTNVNTLVLTVDV